MKAKNARAEETALEAAFAETTRRGAKGNGWLVKRGKTYTACWKFHGKLHKKTTGKTSKAEAEKVLAMLTAEFRNRKAAECDPVGARHVRDREAVIIGAMPALLLGEAAEAYAALPSSENIAPPTMEQRLGLLRRLARVVGGSVEMREVTREEARKFVKWECANGAAPQTRRTHLYALRAIWNEFAEAEDELKTDKKTAGTLTWCGRNLARLTANPWSRSVERFAGAKEGEEAAQRTVARKPLTAEEIGRLVDASEGEMRLLMRLGAATGLRLGDCATLKFGEHISETESGDFRLVVVPKKTFRKTYSRHSVDIVLSAASRELHEELAALPQVKKTGAFVMPGIAETYKRCAPLLASRIRTVFRHAGLVTSVAVPGSSRKRPLYGFHSFRYTMAGIMAGEGLEAARAALGHSNAEMTRHYAEGAKTAEDRAREAARVSAYLHGAKPPAPIVGGFGVKAEERRVYDAVCGMMAALSPSTLRAIAGEALAVAQRAQERERGASTAS